MQFQLVTKSLSFGWGNDVIVLSVVRGRIIRSPIYMKQLAFESHRMNNRFHFGRSPLAAPGYDVYSVEPADWPNEPGSD